MIEHREKIVNLLDTKISIDKKWIKDLEIGIYNWCIKYADSHKIVKNWDNNKFLNLYLEKSRSIISNIDKNSYLQNEQLLPRLLDNEFLPHDIPFMKPQNIFPERWSEISDNYHKKYEHAYENKLVAMTDMYRCGRCKKRECVWHELQTRGGDESSTLFIRCVNCSNSWKIG